MDPTPGNHNSSLRGETGLRRAAMVVIEELGENAAAYAAIRAIILQKQGDEIGASTWRRVAPVIEEMQRKKSTSPRVQTDSTIGLARGTE